MKTKAGRLAPARPRSIGIHSGRLERDVDHRDDMAASDVQVWTGIVGTFATVGVSVLGVLNFQRKRDRSASVGTAFRDVVESLASDNKTQQMAAAILMRRFFDNNSEQGAGRTPYANEAVAVIAGLLRESDTGQIQKVLADGLRYAPSLSQADLQGCNLARAYLGYRKGDKKTVDLTNADLFEADLTGASLRGVTASGAVFYRATLVNAVLADAVLTGADFREARLAGADFGGARLSGARFSGASDIPAHIAGLLDSDGKVVSEAPA
ncbi:pentapeptide repeat-containing protein [Streptomyces sp. NPDC058274]|uniref:pentapeptide repeat-containing protein n=1 Tax=Streptomyces sp. NPDC058274 TaxID=3346416 RepID=UPI0036ED4878